MFAALLLSMATQSAALPDPFATLRDAYERRDAALAATAYSGNAEVLYRYDGAPEEHYRGGAAIRASFVSLFASLDPAQLLYVGFRITAQDGRTCQGIYRLNVGRGMLAYGRFTATIDADGRLTFDESRSATRDESEEAADPFRYATDMEDLDCGHYSASRVRISALSALHSTMSALLFGEIGQFAESLDLGQRQFRSIMRDGIGLAPKALFNLRRIEQGWISLYDTGSMSEPSNLFAHHAQFTREFRRFTGISRRDYKRLKRSGDVIVNGFDEALAAHFLIGT